MVFNRKLGKAFKKVGEEYHIARKDYPKNIIKDIIKISRIKKSSLILDIGCGTGKSTLPFAKKGYKIIGIDISESMLKVAKRLSSKYKNIKYKKASFENVLLAQKSFDLVLVGTAMHWLNPKVAYKKAHNVIKQNGYIAIFWEPIDDIVKITKSLKLINIFLRNCPNYPSNPNKKSVLIKLEKRLMQRKFFYKPIIKRYLSIENYSKKEFLRLINSYSWVISLNKKNKEKLMNELNAILNKKTWPIKCKKEFYLVIAKNR